MVFYLKIMLVFCALGCVTSAASAQPLLVYGYNYIYNDSLINPDVYMFLAQQPKNKDLVAIRPINRETLDSIVGAQKLSRIIAVDIATRRYSSKRLSLVERSIRLDDGRIIPFDSLASLELVGTRRAKNLPLGLVGGAIVVGTQALLWQSVDYLYNKHFDKRQVWTIALGSGIFVGTIASFHRDKTMIIFNRNLAGDRSNAGRADPSHFKTSDE